ncbi:protein turtle homolog A-like [Conger conger]|uniref:protein turtle homolog A-like n=1 Tax=Conger conger TaxID=82655 RepID=UPI002A5A5EAE|nr:protein turtle homolog A-like [Conger conger]
MGPVRLQLLVVCVACAICMLCFAQDQESAVHAKTGGAAELGCSLSLPTPPLLPLHVVEWVRRDFDVPVLIKFGPYAPRVHPSFEHRVSLSRDAGLRVQPVQLLDEGWFECRILRLNRTTAGSVNGTWTFLSVSAPPKFTKTPPPVIQVMQGDSLGLTCAAQGNPHPTITWTKDDMATLCPSHSLQVVDGTLTVGAVTRQMAGAYKCHVSNTEGSLTHATQLKVKGPPAILLPPKDTTLNMSQKAELQCRAEAYPPNMTYVWWRHGENVYHIDSLKSRVKILVDGTLLIPNLIPEDSGNYTCMPTNGLLTPPTASAYLTVKHPAQVVQMAQVTYLPAGMGGRIICPVRADPPLLSVSWTKDERVLDLNMFPGWMLMADGSLFLAAANEDAVGTYSCTPYNSYGTLGPSPPTQVVLQDPPVFSVHPQEEYEQEVGTKLVIPCHAHGDPSPSLTWAKLDRAARSPYTVAANGSLVVEPLSKDHHGVWECVATNRVGRVTASTTVSVLGTSPHAVSSVMVYPGTNQVNVSWEPGFNGGYTQKFTVWMKQTLEPKSKWVSLSTPVPAPPLLVTGLLPGTQYQFSVLPHNRVGTGPFSVMVRVQTLVPLTDLPPTVTMTPELAPPISLSANQSMIGIVLKWVPPPPQGPPLTGFILQSRQKGEIEWNILEGDIGANDSEILLQGLQKDCSYELRMLSLRDGVMSMPSQPLNISTAGIGALHVRLLEGDPEPHVAGVLAGVGVLCAVVLLVMVTACFLNRNKRRRQRRKKREDISSALQKCPSDNRSGARPDSPDSVLKMKACLLNTILPKSHPDLSSSDDSGSREDQDQDKQLLSQLRPKSSLWGCAEGEGATAQPTATLESISRGPDGRFVVRPCKDGPDIPEFPGGGRGSGGGFSHWDCRRSCSLCSERDDLAVVLAVDLPDISTSCSDSDSCTDSSGSNPAGTFAQWSRRHSSLLPQDRAWDVVDGGALVTQMEREKESGHLSRCLTLVREREALERELEHCEARLSSRAWRRETGGTPGPQEGRRQGDPQLREKDCHPPDPRRVHHSGADAARPKGSDSSCSPMRNTHITSVSSCVPAPHLESGAGPYTYASLPTNPET